MFLFKNFKKKHKACFYIYDVNISTRICYMLLIPECDKQTDAHTDTHDDGIYRASIASRGKKSTQPFVCNGVVVASQSFFEVCLLPFSSRPNWSAVVDCGLISNLPWSIWLYFVLCRRFDQTSLSPFWLYSPYKLTVAVWDCRRFGVAVLTFAVLVCRRFDQEPKFLHSNPFLNASVSNKRWSLNCGRVTTDFHFFLLS